MKIRPVGTEFLADRRTDRRAGRQTDRHDESNRRFSNFANAPKKGHGFRVVRLIIKK